MLHITMEGIASIVNAKKFRKIILVKPVEYYDKIEVDRDTRDFYVTETAWDIIKERYLSKYDAHGYGKSYEIDENNILIFVELKKKDDEAKKK